MESYRYKNLAYTLFFWALSMLVFIPSQAQNYAQDALRFSQSTIGGTARVQGIAGANTAIGGDISAVTTNPAGLGFFNKSEFSFSPGITIASTSTTFNTQSNFTNPTVKDSRSSGLLGNFGLVFYTGKDAIEGGKWRGGAFGISLSRTNNFQNRFSFDGTNNTTTKTDFYVERTNGIQAGDLEDLDRVDLEYQRALYFSYLVNPFDLLQNGNTDPNNIDYFSDFRDENEFLLADVKQTGTLETKGSQNQWNFSYGGNYDDKFYFGLAAGINSVNHTRNLIYSESMDSQDAFLVNFSEQDQLRIRGTGFNLSGGFIVRPIDYVRLGVSFTSPTWYSLREEFGTTFTAKSFRPEVTSTTDYRESTLPGNYNYRLTTPWRLNLGAAVFVGKHGFISADAEYLSYNTARLQTTDNSTAFNEDNRFLQNNLQAVWNFKLGAEARLDVFRLRGGVAYQADPYKDNFDNVKRDILNFTGGFGLRMPDWYIDFSLVNSNFNSAYLPYNLSSDNPNSPFVPVVNIKNRIWSGLVSVGFYF
jgi:long-subunit fatty acid transport protein